MSSLKIIQHVSSKTQREVSLPKFLPGVLLYYPPLTCCVIFKELMCLPSNLVALFCFLDMVFRPDDDR